MGGAVNQTYQSSNEITEAFMVMYGWIRILGALKKVLDGSIYQFILIDNSKGECIRPMWVLSDCSI